MTHPRTGMGVLAMRSTTPETGAMGRSIQLPATAAIGFTGHRVLGDEAQMPKIDLRIFCEQRRTSSFRTCVWDFVSRGGRGPAVRRELYSTGIAAPRLTAMPVEEFRKDFDEEQLVARGASPEKGRLGRSDGRQPVARRVLLRMRHRNRPAKPGVARALGWRAIAGLGRHRRCGLVRERDRQAGGLVEQHDRRSTHFQ